MSLESNGLLWIDFPMALLRTTRGLELSYQHLSILSFLVTNRGSQQKRSSLRFCRMFGTILMVTSYHSLLRNLLFRLNWYVNSFFRSKFNISTFYCRLFRSFANTGITMRWRPSKLFTHIFKDWIQMWKLMNFRTRLGNLQNYLFRIMPLYTKAQRLLGWVRHFSSFDFQLNSFFDRASEVERFSTPSLFRHSRRISQSSRWALPRPSRILPLENPTVVSRLPLQRYLTECFLYSWILLTIK